MLAANANSVGSGTGVIVLCSVPPLRLVAVLPQYSDHVSDWAIEGTKVPGSHVDSSDPDIASPILGPPLGEKIRFRAGTPLSKS